MLAWLRKKLKGEAAESSKILEVIPVTETKALHVVERGAKIVLVEVEGEQSHVITNVSDPNLVTYLKSAKGSLKGSAFLAQYLKRAATSPALEETGLPTVPLTPASQKKDPDTEIPAAAKAGAPAPERAGALPATAASGPKPAPAVVAEPVAAMPAGRPAFDVTVDDSTPVPPAAETGSGADPSAGPAGDDGLPALLAGSAEGRPETRTLVPRPQAADAIMQRLEKAMEQHAENVVDGFVPPTESLAATIKISEPVTTALREVVGRQKQRVEALREIKRQEELEKARVEGLLRRKREVEEKIHQIQEMLGRIDQDGGRNQATVETALLATSRDLQQLEEELSKIMTDNGVIRYLLAERDDVIHDANNPLDSMVNSVRSIERQRKQIAAIRHTREQAEAERRRIVVLLIRKNELETAIDEIKQVLKQIDDSNADLIRMDPYAIPEAVPFVAMNELRRLEFELNTILADPGVARKMSEVPMEGMAALADAAHS